MQEAQARPMPDPGRASPVDDVTYDLLQALTSKLEAIEAYRMYADDGTETAALFETLAADERRHAEQLLGALRARLGT
jgi:rubrerythrin